MTWDGLSTGPHHAVPQQPLNRRRRATFVGAGLLAMAVVSFLLGLSVSDAVRLRQVVVYSPDLGLAQEVAQAIELPAGTGTFWLRLSPIRRDVLTCSRVGAVKVERQLPHGVLVRVAPRKPAFAIVAEGGVIVADREGVLLFRSSTPPPSIPVVTAPSTRSLVVGRRCSRDLVEEVVQCLDGATEAALGTAFRLDMSTRYDYKLRTPAGLEVKLGGPDNLKRKVLVAAVIEQHLRRRQAKAAYIDVRIPERTPTWMPLEAAGA